MAVSPVFDLFSFSVILVILNAAVERGGASKELILFCIGMGAASCFKGLLELYRCFVQNRLIQSGAQKLSGKIFELFQKEELAEHNRKSPVQALTIIRSDTVSCMSVVAGFLTLWTQGATLFLFFVILAVVSPAAGVMLGLGMGVMMAAMYVRNRMRMMDLGEKCRKYAIKSNAQVTTAFGMFKETKIDSRGPVLLERYDAVSRAYADAQSRYQYKVQMISVLMQNVLMTLLFFALAAVMGLRIDLARFLAPLIVCMALLLRMLPMAVQFVNELVGVEFSRGSYRAVREAMELYRKLKETEREETEKRKKTLTLRRGLSVRDLTFRYGTGPLLFDHASIDIPAGKTVAIVGASGAGKTTFLDLVLGLLKPECGKILYDDYDIVSGCDAQGACTAYVGDIVSYIPQTVYLNGEDIRTNVAFYEPEGKVDEERVRQCLRYAQIWEEVRKMPAGLHTVIGENGSVISGGQRQRIALARALYKDFEILIMDEATAALDMETEKAVMDSIRHVKGDKTLLMVTHHMSLADECELLYKIENQKLIRVR